VKRHLIIPALNEADNLRYLLPYLRVELAGRGRIIVSDGGSTDATPAVCRHYGVIHFSAPARGRGLQMNAAVTAFPTADVY